MVAMPMDVFCEVAKYLETSQLYTAAAVCKAWRDIIYSNPQLWRHPHVGFVVVPPSTLKPPASLSQKELLHTRLQGLPILSLRMTFKFRDRLYPLRDGGMDDFVRGFIANTQQPGIDGGSARDADLPLHLLLDKVPVAYLHVCLSAAQKVRRVTTLTIASQPYRSEVGSIIAWLEAIKHFSPQDVRIVAGTPEARPSIDTLYRKPLFAGALHQVDEAGGIHTLSFHIPNRFGDTGVFVQALPLIPFDTIKCISVEGGAWVLEATSENEEVLTHLACINLHRLECKRTTARLDALVSLYVSFDDEGKAHWADIARLLEVTMGHSLEVLEFHFPASDRCGQNRHVINDAWKKGTTHLDNLREVTLINYIPRNLSRLLDIRSVASNLQKLVLGGNTLPPDFAKAFKPDILPALRFLDTHDTSFHASTSDKDQQDWLAEWQSRKIYNFEPKVACGKEQSDTMRG